MSDSPHYYFDMGRGAGTDTEAILYGATPPRSAVETAELTEETFPHCPSCGSDDVWADEDASSVDQFQGHEAAGCNSCGDEYKYRDFNQKPLGDDAF